MLAKIREAQEKEEGFTLIELLVVVIIIGILAAIAIPAFLNQREGAWRSAAVSDARNAALEIETAATNSGGNYPAAFDFAADFDGSPDVTLSGYTVNGTNTRFCYVADHDSLDGQVAYDSGAGGVLPYNEAGYACAAGIAAAN